VAARHTMRVATGLAVVLVALLVYFVIHNYQSTRTLAAKQEAVQISNDHLVVVALKKSTLKGCGRFNALRVTLNEQAGKQYVADVLTARAFASVATLEAGLAHTPSSATVVNTSAYQQRRSLELALERTLGAAATGIGGAGAGVQYLPLTNCPAAYRANDNYVQPPAIAWSVHLENLKHPKRLDTTRGR
jgi:hypothetical protein